MSHSRFFAADDSLLPVELAYASPCRRSFGSKAAKRWLLILAGIGVALVIVDKGVRRHHTREYCNCCGATAMTRAWRIGVVRVEFERTVQLGVLSNVMNQVMANTCKHQWDVQSDSRRTLLGRVKRRMPGASYFALNLLNRSSAENLDRAVARQFPNRGAFIESLRTSLRDPRAGQGMLYALARDAMNLAPASSSSPTG